MGRMRTGFTSYLSTGEYTPDFIEDVNLIISKIYDKWSLYEDLEEFTSSCWAKIVTSLTIYNESAAALYTYLNSIIWNEATRIHSKHRRMSLEDTSKLTYGDSVWAVSLNHEEDLLLRDRICQFARLAFGLGVFVDQKCLYQNYLLSNTTPLVKVFMWRNVLNK